VQVKYEMLRRVAVDGVSIQDAARAFGLSHQTFYRAKTDFEEGGVAGLLALQSDAAKSKPVKVPPDYLQIDFDARRVRVAQQDVRLTVTEFTLLQYLVSRSDTPISHEELEQLIWGTKSVNRRACLRVYVNHLRKKIEADPLNPKYIITEPWVGYRFTFSK
jgi:DNA-binding response OmpR family regulator